ncbi:hypothetical protein UP09_11695 [Bradyrhizobium sp. LTSP885]|uniref:DUF3750 domain-containing protein n=1 Tax=Bradyrhizobium sp. LTSP885 TaxID=1619232 RepID=UPI0005C9CCB2|nr:DUF3750 domain-containing protein [Bradyrhizobium sp. LTSP885]KJC46687.1 hypothetical protein UP09_11695 [Bradyrhizobium sp. LTSP885]
MIAFLLLVFVPIGISAGRYYWFADTRGSWQTADRSSAGLLPPASSHPEALIRVFAARTVRWRGIFAVHTWIVVKEAGASNYSRYDYTAWGEPIRVNGFAADGRWFGADPAVVVAIDGEEAQNLIPKIHQVVEDYKFRAYGDYSAWPGPNSNTFVQAALDAVPGLNAVLPPTAIGKDYPYRGRWFGLTASGTGLYATLAGYLGITVGWVEGFEINFFGAVVGFDLRRPALKLPGIGRIGVAAGA